MLARIRSALARLGAPEDPANALTIALPLSGGPKPTEFNVRNLINEGYRRNVVVYCCINEISASAAEPAIVVRNRETKEPVPDSHPLAALFRRPHPDLSKFALMETSLVHLQASGDSYIHKGRNALGEVIRLTPLRPDRMQVIPNPADGSVLGWQYRAEGQITGQFVPRTDVVHVPLPDPLNDYYGLPPLAVCAKFGDIDSEAAGYVRDFFYNGGVPVGLLKLKTPSRPEERARIREQWKESFGRAMSRNERGQWFNIGVLSGDAEYQELGADLAKLRLDAVWGITESRICATFKVPAVVVQVRIGMQFSTYANYEQAQKSFWSETLTPIYARYDERFTSELASEFGEELEVVFDLENVPALQETADQKVERATKLFTAGLMTRDQAREMVGEEPLEGGDVIIVPNGARPLEDQFPAPVALPGLIPGQQLPEEKEPPEPPARQVDLDDEEKKKAKAPPPPKRREGAAAPFEPLVDREELGLVRKVTTPEAQRLRKGVLSVARSIRENVDERALAAALAMGKAERRLALAAAEAAAHWEDWKTLYGDELRRHLQSTASMAGRAVYSSFVPERNREAFAFRPGDKRMAAWVEKHVATEVTRTYRDGRATIREAVLKRLGGGSEAQAVREVRAVIGLTRQQAAAVERLAARLEKEGKTADQVFKASTKYSGKLLDQRAELIAWEETQKAATAAQREAWQQMVEDGVIDEDQWARHWDATSENTCPVCEELDGQEVGLDELFTSDDGEFEGPPDPHIGCECQVILVRRK